MDKNWIPGRIAAAKTAAPVADAVVSALSGELAGTMSERALRPGELAAAAKKLLEAALSPPGEMSAQ